MGASNALAAWRLYSSKVPPLAMSALAYMATVSVDADAEPWFSLGAEMLAVMALGREPLTETGDAKEDAKARKAMEHACERALKPLFTAGAITTARHSSGHPGNPYHAKYRLWLKVPAPDGVRQPRHRSGQPAPHGIRGVRNPGDIAAVNAEEGPAPHGKHGVPDNSAPRIPCSRPTDSVSAPHEIRGAKEYEEYEERENPEEQMVLSSDSVPVRARDEADGNFDDHSAPAEPVAPIRCEYEHCPVPNKPVPAGSRHHTGCGLAMRRAARAKDGGHAA